jgi:hypothetical protein
MAFMEASLLTSAMMVPILDTSNERFLASSSTSDSLAADRPATATWVEGVKRDATDTIKETLLVSTKGRSDWEELCPMTYSP